MPWRPEGEGVGRGISMSNTADVDLSVVAAEAALVSENRMNEPLTHALGRKAYNAYGTATGGLSAATGDELPPWDVLPTEVQNAWAAAAGAVCAEVVFRMDDLLRNATPQRWVTGPH